MIEKIEKGFFFRLTRVFAWVVIVPAFIVFIFSGIKLIKTFQPASSFSVPTFDQVKEKMAEEGQAQQSTQPAAGDSSSALPGNTASLNRQLNEFMSLCGDPEGRNREVVLGWLSNLDEKDRQQFMEGLISIEKQQTAPSSDSYKTLWSGADCGEAANAYVALWKEKKGSFEAQKTQRGLDRIQFIELIAGAFTAVAFFSLMLVLLAIEKNTRKA